MSGSQKSDRRRCGRIRFSWPIWFGYEGDSRLFQGKVVDLSQESVCFVTDDDNYPSPGDHVLTRFSYPRDLSRSFDMDCYFHWSEVLRVDEQDGKQKCIAMRLHRPLECEFGSGLEQEIAVSA